MKLLIDSNILLDILQEREPFIVDSYQIWTLCEKKKVDGFISNLTFANIVYIMRKQIQSNNVDHILNYMSRIFNFEDLQFADLQNAASLKWKDFEDAIQYVTAERIHADYIITRNTKDFQNAKITALTPNEFLEKIHI
jgi:predicted nucleic acid-binding protein